MVKYVGLLFIKKKKKKFAQGLPTKKYSQYAVCACYGNLQKYKKNYKWVHLTTVKTTSKEMS